MSSVDRAVCAIFIVGVVSYASIVSNLSPTHLKQIKEQYEQVK